MLTLQLQFRDEDRPVDEPEVLDAGAIDTPADAYDAPEPDPDDAAFRAHGPRLHPDDPDNFFKLTSALNLLLATSISDEDVTYAVDMLRKYCCELLHVHASPS